VAFHRRLERPDERLRHVDVARPATPSAPGAVLLAMGVDAPGAIHLHHPIARVVAGGGAGETPTGRIEQHLREIPSVRAVLTRSPDMLENGIADPGLCGKWRRREDGGECDTG